MIWRRRLETSFLVLSNHGKLYHGALGAPLKDVMDNVDAGMLLSLILAHLDLSFTRMHN